MTEKIIIFDTTLRDGEQAARASLNGYEKVPEWIKDFDNVVGVLNENVGDRGKFLFLED